MDHQKGFVVGVRSRGGPVEAPRDHGFVVDHGELVMELVTESEARNAHALLLQWLGRNYSGIFWIFPH